MNKMKESYKASMNRITISQKNEPLQSMHFALFPEEYDFISDDHTDAKARKRGENPMNEAYQRKVNLRRFEFGVEPYGGTVGIDNTEGLISSWDYCEKVLLEQTES